MTWIEAPAEVDLDFCPVCGELPGWCKCRRRPPRRDQPPANPADREPADRRELPADDDDEPGPTIHQIGVAAELRRLRIQQDARRELAAETSCTPRRPAPVLLSDLLDEPEETTEYRIGGLLPIGARVVLAAQYKAGKTTLVGNTIRSLVDGDPFLGAHEVTPTRRRVVVVDTEMSRKTLRRWLRDQQIRDPGVAVEALRGRVSSLDVLDPAVRREWADALRALDPGVLILDCLRPVLDALGLDENTDTGQVLVALDEISESAGVDELIVVHHMGHTGERSRGSSRLRDWPDVEWRLVRKDPDDPASPRFFSAYGRDVDVSESALNYDPDTRHLTLAGGSRRDAAVDAVITDLVDLLTDQPGLSGRGIEDVLIEAGITRQVGRDAVKRAIDQGYVTTTAGPKRSHLHYATPASAPVRRSAPARTGAPVKVCASAPIEGAHSHTRSEQSSAPDGAHTCSRCHHPAERLIRGLCPRCAYPAGGNTDDDPPRGESMISNTETALAAARCTPRRSAISAATNYQQTLCERTDGYGRRY